MSSNIERTAIIIGVNEYPEAALTLLQGAEQDALEVQKRLVKIASPFNYKIPDDQCLTGKNATYKKIRYAIDKVFRKSNDFEMVLFFFSGHGLVDSKGRGYIATYDMGTDPYVCGIDMQELRSTLFSSINREAKVLMMLDCCHSGVAASGSGKGKIKKTFDSSLQKTIAPFSKYETLDRDLLKASGKGKLLMASSEAEVSSREDKCTHQSCPSNEKGEHYHGRFTYALLEGLDGAPNAVDEKGFISFDKLRKHITQAMKRPDGHDPIFYGEEYTATEDFRIAVSPQAFEDQLKKVKQDIYDCVRCQNYVAAARYVTDMLERLQCESTKLIEYDIDFEKIDRDAREHYKKVRTWVDINESFSIFVDPEPWNMIKRLGSSQKDLQNLGRLSWAERSILNILFDAANNPKTKSVDRANKDEIRDLAERISEAIEQTSNKGKKSTDKIRGKNTTNVFHSSILRSETNFTSVDNKVPR